MCCTPFLRFHHLIHTQIERGERNTKCFNVPLAHRFSLDLQRFSFFFFGIPDSIVQKHFKTIMALNRRDIIVKNFTSCFSAHKEQPGPLSIMFMDCGGEKRTRQEIAVAPKCFYCLFS